MPCPHYFRVESTRDNKSASAEFEQGNLSNQELLDDTSRRKGTKVSFIPDDTILKTTSIEMSMWLKCSKTMCT